MYFILITEEDDKNLTSDLVKLDRYLYWADLKGSFLMGTHHQANKGLESKLLCQISRAALLQAGFEVSVFAQYLIAQFIFTDC